MMVHNGSMGGVTPDLMTFPKAWVCFDCGLSTFTLTKNELLNLERATPVRSVPAP
jgi:hypothetical protein